MWLRSLSLGLEAIGKKGRDRPGGPSLHRLMRTLASLGILTERGDRRFALTPLGEALKTGAPGSARASLLTVGSPWFNSAFDHIVHSLQTGETGFEKAQGMPVFDYLAQHPDDASLFSETMIGIHGEEPPAVADAYDFPVFGTVVDVGGATGNLLSAILSRHPGPRGILFDRPHVVTDAPALLAARGVEDRVTIEAGTSSRGSQPAATPTSFLRSSTTGVKTDPIWGPCRPCQRSPNRRSLP
jgi:hypothetical protein